MLNLSMVRFVLVSLMLLQTAVGVTPSDVDSPLTSDKMQDAIDLNAGNSDAEHSSSLRGKSKVNERKIVEERSPPPRAPVTPEEIALAKEERALRIRARREKAREKINQLQPTKIERLSIDEVNHFHFKALENDPKLERPENQWLRRAGWSSSSVSSNPYQNPYFADPGGEYDWWAQGYRMLGGFIDCDHAKSSNNRDKKDNNNNNLSATSNACSRWMMWAAYVNPNYQGGGRSEYYPDSSYTKTDDQMDDNLGRYSNLDCHKPDTEWILLGVYRQEFYQYIEQISKHLWAADDYEYVVALAGLSYMTKYDCFQAGYDSSGSALYAGIRPMEKGTFQIALYTDDACLQLDTTSGMTYDDFGHTTSMKLSSKDKGGNSDTDYDTLYSYWQSTQEYTLTLLNEVYQDYKYCTLCLDYPTYQDGYFIGDYGTDEDDLINQCWKFHSHNSYTCEADCIALGDAQGSITLVKYGDRYYGQEWDGSSSATTTTFDLLKNNYSTFSTIPTKLDRIKANIFVTFAGILFFATFLAFSAARNANKVERSEKSRALLTEEEKRASRSKPSPRSKSKDGRRPRSQSRSRKESNRDGTRDSTRESARESTRESTKESSHRSPSSKKDKERKRDKDDKQRGRSKSKTRESESKTKSSRGSRSRSKSRKPSSKKSSRIVDDY